MRLLKTKKGFTLIELMIVIAIISVLAVTLVPQLTGAQARSRDAGRVSSLKNITAVLETYYSDEGMFPLAPNHATDENTAAGTACFSSSAGVVAPAIAELLKGGTSPVDPQATNTSGACTTNASFGYSALNKSGIPQGGYIILSNVETYKKANLDWSKLPAININGSTTYSTVQGDADAWGDLASETTNAKHSSYAEIN
jgi:prepilin-type N-terminal cleavage/methylation domain-containing protein